ncbi:PREDICTED: mitotic interactor and substrate of PLK1 [Chinchilla lanigera]|uniref:Mitotic spindle positioning n=1 Tax=Chinchilla lanigera TaxID=34839 RepID=A0A8C2W7J7_CHILA|nr:PREDICTED: mitotic interactor and substrate of PLK1 [Chinchilla lanigera]XP_013360796.1 PREDICTED: mitotic interactor and substrate of PLK1 [Chinchilla lanigera]XP_013360797.1 PREDICTED: mitotic interactor and substrate of PLK1 [Chinchilla lanigera]XP_013360798.1 PREDICTED: mitotic interactor and substrate of PLK1 [Chinchilla lanigera]
MDRGTRYPIFSDPHSARVTGLALDGDASYRIELVGVGPEDNGWVQDEIQAFPTDWETHVDSTETRVLRGRYTVLGHPAKDRDEETKVYLLDASHGPPRQLQDLERERRAVIQGQAVRKGSTVATLRGTPDHQDGWPPGPLQSSPLEEEDVIDREQIDFLAARQRFLQLEQAGVNRTSVSQSPLARVSPARAQLGFIQAPKASHEPQLANGYVVPAAAQDKEVVMVEKTARSFVTGPGVQAVDNSSPWSQATNNSSFRSQDKGHPSFKSQTPDVSHLWSQPTEDPGSWAPELPKETPIEREIRLAQEREADLREQRGLGRAAGHQELVEILTRPVLTKASLTESPRRDRGRPSLYVQRDMVQETQREEDHRRMGLQPSGTSTPDWVSEDPQPALERTLSSESILNPMPDARAADQAPETRKVNRIPPDAYQPYLGGGIPQQEFSPFWGYRKPSAAPTAEAKPLGSPKSLGFQRPLSESSGKPVSTKSPRGHLQASRTTVPREYFCLRPLQFRVPEVQHQAETPHVWGWEEAGAPALRLKRTQSSDLLEREVEDVLRREREMEEQRRSASFPEVFSPVSEDEGCERDSRSSSRASGITGSYSVSESPLFTPIHLHSGLVWTAEPPTDGAAEHRRKGQWYAGINPSDGINSEILGATRVTRHKNAMARRWEAGIYASEDED